MSLSTLTVVGTKVGIGVDVPAEALHVGVTTAGTGLRLQGPLPAISLYDTAGTLGSLIALQLEPVGAFRGLQIHTPDKTGALGVSDNWNIMRFNGGNNKLFFGDTGVTSWIQSGHYLSISTNRAGVPSVAATPDVTIDSGSLTVRNDVIVNGSIVTFVGANKRAGNVTLVGGTATVANTSVTSNTIVMYVRKTLGGTPGALISYSVFSGVSFTISSDNPLDTSTFSYFLIEAV